MSTKVQDLTIDELRIIISDTVKDTVGDMIEDIIALSNKEYIDSVKEARKDYKTGQTEKYNSFFRDIPELGLRPPEMTDEIQYILDG